MKNLFLLLLLGAHCFLFSEKTYATNYVWNGTTSNWSDATRWTPNGVPGASDNVTISSGTVTLDAAQVCSNLTFSAAL